MFKADIFVAGADPWRTAEFGRGVSIEIEEGRPALRFSSAEDILLHKLRWSRDGGSVSERQWNDVRSLIRVQGGGLDRAYLQR